MWLSYTTCVADHLNTSSAAAWVVVAVVLHGVWRLWRGMGPDPFQRRLRALRERRRTTIALRPTETAPRVRRGLLQVSLFPLMLISFAAAILLAQAQRPDDVSRPLTWALFIGAGAWYGTRLWAHHRGVGPLRNCAFAGAVSGAGVSALLWGFYLAVDSCRDGRIVGRMAASFPTLLWWTAVGGVLGALVGAARANRAYSLVGHHDTSPRAATGDSGGDDLSVTPSVPARRTRWGTVAMACAASALFHCSAAPYVYREVRLRYCWAWDWNGPHHVDNSIMVTMAPAAPNPYEDSFLLSEYPYALPMHVTPKRDIAAGEKITRDMLTVEPIYPNGSDWIVEPGAAVGKYANETLPAGYSIRAAQLSDRTPLASGAPQAPPQQAAAAWYGPSRPAGVGAAQAAFDQQLAGTVSDPASPEVPSPIDESPTDDSQPPQANPYAVSAADSQASGDPPLGLEGYCPVTVVTRKKWWQGDSRYEAVHRGRTYLFAGATERRMFLAKPDRFSPALSGYDPVRYRKTGQLVDGKREHGVTYMDRMFLFADEASLQEFWQAPDGYLNESPPAMRPATAAPDPTPGTISADDRQASGDAPLGLDGYCPVTMLTLRQWRKGDSRYGVVHRRRTYLFVGEAQQKQFLADPDRFSLMFSGYDPVHFQETGQLVDGKREHGVTYNDRMVLFATKKSMTEFLSSPDAYMNQALPQ